MYEERSNINDFNICPKQILSLGQGTTIFGCTYMGYFITVLMKRNIIKCASNKPYLVEPKVAVFGHDPNICTWFW